MLHRDYLLDIIEKFVEGVSAPLSRALLEGDLEAARDVESAVAGLLDLDPSIAMGLAPNSLVTMMLLSGVGDSVAAYVCYALRRLAQAYQGAGEAALAELRSSQAQAIEESFAVEPGLVPAEFARLDVGLS
ncbi:hypothetical protein [Olsenella urininfantis]|uniref:hypothetical protein n=1 Tax=Olsenella urininfantis TaxID=1871033 RepID=UPI000986DC9C|nr:hypothetical protein [Olsenella urininfantis]